MASTTLFQVCICLTRWGVSSTVVWLTCVALQHTLEQPTASSGERATADRQPQGTVATASSCAPETLCALLCCYLSICCNNTQGNGKLIFQGCISYLACILITYLGFAMLRFANIEQKYMRKLDGAARTVRV